MQLEKASSMSPSTHREPSEAKVAVSIITHQSQQQLTAMESPSHQNLDQYEPVTEEDEASPLPVDATLQQHLGLLNMDQPISTTQQ